MKQPALNSWNVSPALTSGSGRVPVAGTIAPYRTAMHSFCCGVGRLPTEGHGLTIYAVEGVPHQTSKLLSISMIKMLVFDSSVIINLYFFWLAVEYAHCVFACGMHSICMRHSVSDDIFTNVCTFECQMCEILTFAPPTTCSPACFRTEMPNVSW